MRTQAQPTTSDIPPADAEVLIQEARHLRRRRWLLGLIGVVVATAVGVSLAAIGGGHAKPGGVTVAQHPRGEGGGSTSSQVPDPSAAPPVVESGLLNGTTGWVVNGLDLYLTTDAGQTWQTITPKALTDNDPVARMEGLEAVDSSHLWLPVEEVGLPGGRCVDGSCRGSGIESTTDAGRSWHLTYLSNCLECNISVSFLNADDGFALGQQSNNDVRSTVRTYKTDDGGRTWTLVAAFSIPIGGGSNSLTFTTATDGWFTASELTTAVLYRTTNGGRHWTRVSLPALHAGDKVLDTSGPTFFGPSQGVVVEAVENTSARLDHDVIYTTSDGGNHWSEESAPAVVPNTTFNTDATLSVSVASKSSWVLLAGDRLYVTHDAGRSWSSDIPSARWSDGPFRVAGIDFLTGDTGWVNALYNACGGLPRKWPTTARCPNAIALAATTNGGRSWTLLSTNSG